MKYIIAVLTVWNIFLSIGHLSTNNQLESTQKTVSGHTASIVQIENDQGNVVVEPTILIASVDSKKNVR